MTTHAAATAKALNKGVSSAARARARNDKVVREAGTTGHVVSEVPAHGYRTDLVNPVLSFVVYGHPSPQGSKNGYVRGGKVVMKESSDGLGPWRDAVRAMAKKAIAEWAARQGRPWEALDEAVMVSPTITMPATKESTKTGAVYHMGRPDLDKLQRALGDALAPVPLRPSDGKSMTAAATRRIRDQLKAQREAHSVLVEDSRIAAWGQPLKVYPNTIPTSLGYAGTLIQIWRMADLEAAARRPFVTVDGALRARAGDLRSWARPDTGQSWSELSGELWSDPAAVLGLDGAPVELLGRAITAQGARSVLAALALHGPDHLMMVDDAARC